ncbi:hypothetical protein EYF80_046355 [Liparis tanakae]|uniref:Uncharacterized protein n=1 Tax=Liparis tanakae TaxID=230148 RepID=A0A4Z2FQF7_9TELE|nr:hypothetical protein EYF80_046355 [Liparis tanakae]
MLRELHGGGPVVPVVPVGSQRTGSSRSPEQREVSPSRSPAERHPQIAPRGGGGEVPSVTGQPLEALRADRERHASEPLAAAPMSHTDGAVRNITTSQCGARMNAAGGPGLGPSSRGPPREFGYPGCSP